MMDKQSFKLPFLLAIVSTGILTTGAQAASIAWDGEGSDGIWQTGLNWDTNSVPTAADDVTISNGDTVTYVPGGDLTVDGGSVTVSGGSTLTQTASNWARINNGTLTLNDSTFSRAGGNVVLAFNTDNNSGINAVNSNFSIGGELWFGHNNNTGNQVVSVNLTNSTIDANGVVGIWFWDTDAAGNSFSLNINGAGSTVEGRVGRRNTGGSNNAVTWETLWDEGILTYNGSNAGLFADHFITSGTAGTGDYTLTSIPEPSSLSLISLVCFGLLMRKHRKP
ncbi:hypothetical protein Rhal01_03582 [Rubritalea halochordaticola]|uniref:PEP-CTERM sorting domain-containing protein n=2 Tax=Rubritalea halochordaticola TaxID=714537 RepID=A0ABP9V3Y9_9BACT